MWGQRTTVRVDFPFYHLILSIQLRPLVLVVGPFTHWALTSTQSIVKCNLPRDKACFADKVVLILLLQQIKSQCVHSVCCKMLSVHTWTPGKLSLRITSSILFLTSIYFILLSPPTHVLKLTRHATPPTLYALPYLLLQWGTKKQPDNQQKTGRKHWFTDKRQSH